MAVFPFRHRNVPEPPLREVAAASTVAANRVMKIMLQDGKTRRYVAEGGDWSDNADMARVFTDLADARRYGLSRSFPDLRIIAVAGGELARAARVSEKEQVREPY